MPLTFDIIESGCLCLLEGFEEQSKIYNGQYVFVTDFLLDNMAYQVRPVAEGGVLPKELAVFHANLSKAQKDEPNQRSKYRRRRSSIADRKPFRCERIFLPPQPEYLFEDYSDYDDDFSDDGDGDGAAEYNDDNDYGYGEQVVPEYDNSNNGSSGQAFDKEPEPNYDDFDDNNGQPQRQRLASNDSRSCYRGFQNEDDYQEVDENYDYGSEDDDDDDDEGYDDFFNQQLSQLPQQDRPSGPMDAGTVLTAPPQMGSSHHLHSSFPTPSTTASGGMATGVSLFDRSMHSTHSSYSGSEPSFSEDDGGTDYSSYVADEYDEEDEENTESQQFYKDVEDELRLDQQHAQHWRKQQVSQLNIPDGQSIASATPSLADMIGKHSPTRNLRRESNLSSMALIAGQASSTTMRSSSLSDDLLLSPGLTRSRSMPNIAEGEEDSAHQMTSSPERAQDSAKSAAPPLNRTIAEPVEPRKSERRVSDTSALKKKSSSRSRSNSAERSSSEKFTDACGPRRLPSKKKLDTSTASDTDGSSRERLQQRPSYLIVKDEEGQNIMILDDSPETMIVQDEEGQNIMIVDDSADNPLPSDQQTTRSGSAAIASGEAPEMVPGLPYVPIMSSAESLVKADDKEPPAEAGSRSHSRQRRQRNAGGALPKEEAPGGATRRRSRRKPASSQADEGSSSHQLPLESRAVFNSGHSLSGELAVVVKHEEPIANNGSDARITYQLRVLGKEGRKKLQHFVQQGTIKNDAVSGDNGNLLSRVSESQISAAPESSFWARLTVKGKRHRLPFACHVEKHSNGQTCVRVKFDSFPGMAQVVPVAQTVLGKDKCSDWLDPVQVLETLKQSPSRSLTSKVADDAALQAAKLESNEIVVDTSKTHQALLNALTDFEILVVTDKTIGNVSEGAANGGASSLAVYRALFSLAKKARDDKKEAQASQQSGRTKRGSRYNKSKRNNNKRDGCGENKENHRSRRHARPEHSQEMQRSMSNRRLSY